MSDAIIKLLCIPGLENKIFHIFSNKLINMSMLLKIFEQFDVHCKFTSYDQFIKNLNKPENEKFLKYIITDINSKKGFNYESDITVDSSITDDFLDKVRIYLGYN